MNVIEIFRFVRFAIAIGPVLAVFSVAVQVMNSGDSLANSFFDETDISRPRRPYQQWLDNHMDVEYTGNITVGKKTFQAILDTGSFDLQVCSTKCKECGAKSDLYHATPDKKNGQKGLTMFGSGTMYSDEATDEVMIGPLYSRALDFWAVTRAQMPVLGSEPTFQAVLGLAPPSGALKCAEEQAYQLSHLSEVSNDRQDILDRYNGILRHAKKSAPFLKTISLTSMSTCFHKESRSPGYHFWHDMAVREQGNRFVTIPVVGSTFWSSDLTDVRLRMETLGELSGKTPTITSQGSMGCTKQTCSAVFDTGSSLIAAPPDQAVEIYRVVYDWLEQGGTCDDVSSLPDLEFVVGGVTLTLPPEAYVGVAEGEFTSDVSRLLALTSLNKFKGTDGQLCMPLLMPVAQEVDGRDIWIMGMPFFRKYYTNFALSESQVATNMSFSVADENCQPGSSPGVAALRSGEEKMQKRSSQMRVHAPKLKLPSIISGQLFFSEVQN